tara:strand:+ start:11270 stop:18853 length:7584 start_codon:yes stop_codon:yes gene_type:complete
MVAPVKSNQQHIFVHDAICEGPVQGLVYGKSSVYVNGNRLQNLNSEAAYDPIKGSATCSGTTFTITGQVIPAPLRGTPTNTNYLAVRKPGTSKSGTASFANQRFTIVCQSALPTTFNTEESETKLIVLTDPDTDAVLMVGQGKLDSSDNTNKTILFTPRNPLNSFQAAHLATNTVDYKVGLLETLEINTITETTITVKSAPTLGNGTYTWFVTGAIQPDADEIDEAAPAKYTGSHVEFRNGSTFQDPIPELNGVGGGTPYTGNLATFSGEGGILLRQMDLANWNAGNVVGNIARAPAEFEKIVLNAAQPNVYYSTAHYPEGETIATEGATAPTIISSSAFGLNSTTAPTVDELRIAITYNNFIAINKDNGDEHPHNAIYLFQIRLKRPGEATFENKYRHAFRSADGTHIGQVFHDGKHKSAISFEHFIDLNPFRPFIDFEIRLTRLTRHKGRANTTRGADHNLSTGNAESGDTTGTISALTAINKDIFSYPYTAHAGVFLDSRDFQNVPKRSYEIQGLRIRVPEGYIPRDYSTATETKGGVAYTVPTYPEYWNGSMSEGLYYTNNPAWVFYDIIVNDRFGAGEWLRPEDIDLYALYKISKYCDELVEDCKGGYEPRFTANLMLTKATDVYKVLKDIATIFTSLVYWLDGKMTTILDAPGDPVHSFTRGNVLDGAFSYETTGQKTRTNQVVVTWNNPEVDYEQQALVIEDRDAIISEGRIIKENAMAFGCTSEGQAKRYGKWKLFTAQNQTEIVSFKTSFEGIFIKPGDIIQIQDAARYGAQLSGRLLTASTSGNATTVTLDRPVTLSGSSQYELTVLLTEPAAFYIGEGTVSVNAGPNPSTQPAQNNISRGDRVHNAWINITSQNDTDRVFGPIDTKEKAANAYTNNGATGELLNIDWKEHSFIESKPVANSQTDVSSLTTTEAYSTLPVNKSIWMLTETTSGTATVGSPDLYRVLGISQEEPNIYAITAVEHFDSKYDFVDNPDAADDIPDDVYPSEPEDFTPPDIVRVLQTSDNTRPGEELIVEWEFPAITIVNGVALETSRHLDGFEIKTNIPDQETLIFAGKRERTYKFENVPDGEYVFRVRAVSVRGNKSDWVTARYDVDNPFSDKVNRINGLQTEGLSTDFPFITAETAGGGGYYHGDYDTTGNVVYTPNDVVREPSTGFYWYLGSLSAFEEVQRVGHGSIAIDLANDPDTWKRYRGGILRFREGVTATIAPSRFKRNEAKSLGSSFSFDCLNLKSDVAERGAYPGETDGTKRIAYLVSDHSDTSKPLKLVGRNFDDTLNLFYWFDIDRAYTETGVAKYWAELNTLPSYGSTSGTVSIAANSNKVVGVNTKFTKLNNLNKLYFSNTKAARVAFVESDTVLFLDRSFDTAVSAGTTAYVQAYAPDFIRDFIVGRVVYDTSTGDFSFNNFLALDPNLEGKRSVLIDTNVAFLQYNPDEELTLAPPNIEIVATAQGFEDPQFKLTYGDPSTAPSGSVFAAPDATFLDNNVGLFGYKKQIWNGNETIPYSGGSSFTIQVEVIEKNDPGNGNKAVTDTITISKQGDVAAGEGNRSVFLELEDYTVVYESGGVKPVYEGSPNYLQVAPTTQGNLTFTATASAGFGDPIFRFKVASTVLQPTVNGALTNWFDPGGDIATIDFPVPTTIGTPGNYNWVNENGGSKTVVVEVAEKPSNWTPNIPASGTNTNEPPTSEIYAKDVDNILAVRIGYGGLTFNFTNDSHVIPCDKDGVVQSSANSGGKLEVFLGGVGLDFKASNPSAGEFTISGTSTTENFANNVGIQVGSITEETQSSGPTRANIADHTFTGALNNAPFELTEAITYTLTIPQGNGFADITTTITQTFTFIKDGDAQGTGLVYLYKKSTNAPAGNELPGTSFPQVKVVLATGLVDHSGNDPNGNQVFQNGTGGWYTSANGAAAAVTGTAPIWIIAATANGVTTTSDFILYNEWSAPVQFSGSDGAAGINSATIELFRQNNDQNNAPADPTGALTYTFASGALETGTDRNNWSTTMPSPSRALPYVWRISAAAISNTATDDIANTEWSTPALVARFVEDGITLELTNDSETVIGPASTALSGLSVTTTAKVFAGGTDVTSSWNFSTTIPSGATVNSSTGSAVNGTGTNFNNFTVSALSATFSSGNLAITASPKSNGAYAGFANRTNNFTVSVARNGEEGDAGESYRIISSADVVVHDPNSTPVANAPTSLTFSAVKITEGASSAFDSGYWKINGSNATADSNGDVSTSTGSGSSGSFTAELYLDLNRTQLVDKEVVPIISEGSDSTATGNDAARNVNGYLYWVGSGIPSNSNKPTNISYNFNATTLANSNFTQGSGGANLSSWSVNTPTVSASQTTVYYITFSAVETVTNGTAQNTGPVSFGNVATGTNFTGLVTFSGDSLTTANGNTINLTQIDGGTIKTGTIEANLTASSSARDGTAFTTAGSYFNLATGAIASPAFRVQPGGSGASAQAEFKGTLQAASFEGTNTMSTTNGKITISASDGSVQIDATSQQIKIIDGTGGSAVTRVILGKLS